MVLFACQRCGRRIPATAGYCPTCGAPAPGRGPPQKLPTLREPSSTSPPIRPARPRGGFLRWLTGTQIGRLFGGGFVAAIFFSWIVTLVDQPAPAVEQPVAPPAPPASPSMGRFSAAQDLQRRFDRSLVANWRLLFFVRGAECDVLQVEAETVDLDRETMVAIAHGTVIYGQIVPGGVNSFAFDRGFRNVVYTNARNRITASFGTPEMSRTEVKRARLCSEAEAATLEAESAPAGSDYVSPAFAQLSWNLATQGRRIFDASYEPVGTIRSVDRARGMIYVKFDSGGVEPKLLESVAPYWYVEK
jgi:hypothetical protein